MLDKEFCDELEWVISDVLALLKSDHANGFWCDGVCLPIAEKNYSASFVNDHRKVELTALTGKTGQEEYLLTLHFGPKSLSRYARGLDIISCIPEPGTDGWFHIDTDQKQMEIDLF